MKRFCILFLVLLTSLIVSSQTLYNYPNLLNLSHYPSTYDDTITASFSANGSWFGIGLPAEDETGRFGRLYGPYSTYMNKWIAKSLLQVNLGIAGIGKIQYESAKSSKITQYPGLLVQEFDFESFMLIQRSVFISGRTCLIQVDAINTSESKIPMSLMMKGSTFAVLGEAEEFMDGWMYKIDNKDDILWLLRFRLDKNMNLAYNPDSYEFSYKEPVIVEPGDTLSMVATISQFFKGDSRRDILLASEALNEPESFFNKNEKLWRFLINNIVPEDKELRKLSVKSLQTIYLNLRSYLPNFRNYFFVDNAMQRESFISVDNSWLYASSIIRYDAKLAQNVLYANTANLNKDNSLNNIIPVLNYSDTVFKTNDKPMAAWTAWNIFSTASDTKEMELAYPILKNYHDFWYENHNVDNNLWCEDDLGIERADLNALLFTEKYCLSKMAEKLGYDEDVKLYQGQMDSIKYYYSTHFFNLDLMSFVDFNLNDGTITPSDQAIGYSMWSGLAAFDVAEYYAAIIQSKLESGYYQQLFASGEYNIEDYYFLISGLKLYKHEELSQQIKTVLLNQIIDDSENKPLATYSTEGKEYNHSTLTAAVLLLLINY